MGFNSGLKVLTKVLRTSPSWGGCLLLYLTKVLRTSPSWGGCLLLYLTKVLRTSPSWGGCLLLYLTKVLRTSPSWGGCLLTSSSAPPFLRFPRILSTSQTSASVFVRRENCRTRYVGGNTAAVSSAESLGLADMSPSVCGCRCVIYPAQIEGSQKLHNTHCMASPQGSNASTCLQRA